MTDSPLKILLMAAEMVPFAKTGGLADVTGALPKALKAQGHDVRVAMPRYGRIDRERFQRQRGAGAIPRADGRPQRGRGAAAGGRRLRQRRCAGLYGRQCPLLRPRRHLYVRR